MSETDPGGDGGFPPGQSMCVGHARMLALMDWASRDQRLGDGVPGVTCGVRGAGGRAGHPRTGVRQVGRVCAARRARIIAEGPLPKQGGGGRVSTCNCR